MHATQFGLERHILRLETYRVTTYCTLSYQWTCRLPIRKNIPELIFFLGTIPELNLSKGKIYIPCSLLKGNDNTNILRVFSMITKILRAENNIFQ
jgi:hypothetical protein